MGSLEIEGIFQVINYSTIEKLCSDWKSGLKIRNHTKKNGQNSSKNQPSTSFQGDIRVRTQQNKIPDSSPTKKLRVNIKFANKSIPF